VQENFGLYHLRRASKSSRILIDRLSSPIIGGAHVPVLLIGPRLRSHILCGQSNDFENSTILRHINLMLCDRY
jgi:hypothetical protein